MRGMRRTTRRRGFALVLALMLIGLFVPMSVALFSMANTNLQISENHAAVQTARYQAESGLTYLTYHIRNASLPDGASGPTLLSAVATHLSTQLDGSPAMAGTILHTPGESISVPPIVHGSTPGAFQALITLPDPTTIRLRVTGQNGTISRDVGVSLGLQGGGSGFFDKGIAAKGPIRMTGNAKVEGVNDPAEAACLSATYDVDEAFNLTGNCSIDGSISLSDPDAYISTTGNVSVGGQSYPGVHTIDLATVQADPESYEGFNIGVGEVEFPEVDSTVFESFATNMVTSSTSTTGNKTFTNIRIAANSNKTFSGNITLNGVIFIEQPNRIQFSGNVNLTGVVVTQDAGDDAYDSNTLKFTGNLTARGVEELPDTPEFGALRTMPGSFVLAPGFGVEFTGNFGTVGGTMAADKFKWTGNAGGVVRGSVISYSDDEFKLTGNSRIQIDRSGMPEVPPGFSGSSSLVPVVTSYEEY